MLASTAVLNAASAPYQSFGGAYAYAFIDDLEARTAHLLHNKVFGYPNVSQLVICQKHAIT